MLKFTRQPKVVLAGLTMTNFDHLVENFCHRGRTCSKRSGERSPESSYI